MNRFITSIQQKLAFFTPFLAEKVTLSGSNFHQRNGTVAEFVAEIEQICRLISQQTEAEKIAFYTQKLVIQFEGLYQAVELLQKNANRRQPKFQSGYQFPANIHKLPKEQRLLEYKKALRALNEKIMWLTEQSYRATNAQEKQQYLNIIQETEYRKQKCLSEIEKLE